MSFSERWPARLHIKIEKQPDGPHRMSFFSVGHFHGVQGLVVGFFPPWEHDALRIYEGPNAIIIETYKANAEHLHKV